MTSRTGSTLSGGDGQLPYYFLTYAHTSERGWVRKLHRELSKEIYERTDWRADSPLGFMDEEGIRTGEDWRESVASALASSRVLVPLYSRRFFTSRECGREWHAFTRRVNEHRARHGPDSLTPIVPALWTPVDELHIPPAVRHVQADFRAVHVNYASEGLYTLIKNSRYRSTYLQVVKALATQIIAAAERRPVLPSCEVVDLELGQDAFQRVDDVPLDRRLTIVVAAPSRYSLPADRSAVPYGPSPTDWNPYGEKEGIGLVAETLARAADYEPDVVSVTDGLERRDWTRGESGVGVVLVDPWLCLDPRQVEQIRRIDALGAGRIGVVVVWNRFDQQTRERGEAIREALAKSAPQLLGDPSTPAALGAVHVYSAADFRKCLQGVIRRAHNRYLNVAPASGPPGSVAVLPTLGGSGDTRRGDDPGGSDGDD